MVRLQLQSSIKATIQESMMRTATVYDNECTITRDGMGFSDRFASTDAMASHLKAIVVANEAKTIDDTAMVKYSREPGVS